MQIFWGKESDTTLSFELNGTDYVSYVYKVVDWLSNNLGWAMLSITILLVLPTWMLFRFSPKYSYHTLPEGFFIQLFMSCLMLIAIALSEITNWFLLLIPIYYYFSYRQLFGYRFWGTLWRLFLCALVWLIALFDLIVLAGIFLVQVVDHEANGKAVIIAVIGIALFTLPIIAFILFFGYRISKKRSVTHCS